MSQAIKKPRALEDLRDHAIYLEEHASLEVAERFLSAAESAFSDLLAMPRMGRQRETTNPHLADLRQWPVPGFEKYLVFYQPTEGGIDVVRVLHGARDLDALLDEEEQEGPNPP